MRLRDLDAAFIQCFTRIDTWKEQRPGEAEREVTGPRVFNKQAQTIQEAHGVEFLCPLCYEKNGGHINTHLVICWFKDKVPAEAEPGPGRWAATGTGIDDLTLAPSVNLPGEKGCKWHGFVKDGLTSNV